MSEQTHLIPSAQLGEGEKIDEAIRAVLEDGDVLPEFVNVFDHRGHYVGMWVTEDVMPEHERPTDPALRFERECDVWFYSPRSPTREEKDLGMVVRELIRKCQAGIVLTDERARMMQDLLRRTGV